LGAEIFNFGRIDLRKEEERFFLDEPKLDVFSLCMEENFSPQTRMKSNVAVME
jgi:hypothetical protein